MSYIYPLNPCFYEVFEKYPILLKQIMGMEKEQKEMILMTIDAKSFVKSLQSFLSNEIICYEDDCICFEDSIEKKRYFLHHKDGGGFSVASQGFARYRETPWLQHFAGITIFGVSMEAGGNL